MITKTIRYFGITILLLFSIISIFFSLAERELQDHSPYKKMLSYPSFFEDRFYDARMMKTLDKKALSDHVVLAEIDDLSLNKIGRFPWGRTVWAKFLKKMQSFGAQILSFDVFFPEPELACSAALPPDEEFAQAIKDFQSQKNHAVILPYALSDVEFNTFKEVPDSLYNLIIDSKQTEGMSLRQMYVDKGAFPITTLTDTESPLGFIGVVADADGIIRHYPLLSNVDSLYFPSFALITYLRFTQNEASLEMPSLGEAVLKFSHEKKISLNYKGETKVRWMGGEGNFPKRPMHEILNAPDDDPVMKELFHNKIVFIGSTAYGAHDLRHTPIDPILPGVYFHMNMVEMLLKGYFFQEKEQSAMYSWALLVFATVVMMLIMLMRNALIDLAAIVILSAGIYYLDTYYLLPKGFEIKLFFVLFAPISTYSWNTFINFYLASKEKKQIRGTFSRYVAPAIVDQMLANPEKLKVGGEKKNITVFFSDVRDFTTISESLTPNQLSTCLNLYMGKMTNVIFETSGTLDKYIGDAIVAFWGAPVEIKNHAYAAVTAAIKMIEILPEINETFKAQGFPEFKHGIGLNTGDCSVGNMGSDKIFAYTALGDNMNLGARLESLCKYYGVQLNVSEFTIAAIPEDLRKNLTYRIIDKVRVKGKSTAVTIYEVYHSFHPLKLDTWAHESFCQAFSLYQKQQFQAAIDLLAPVCEKHPADKSSKRVKEICQQFLLTPPPADWDGAYTHTTKG